MCCPVTTLRISCERPTGTAGPACPLCHLGLHRLTRPEAPAATTKKPHVASMSQQESRMPLPPLPQPNSLLPEPPEAGRAAAAGRAKGKDGTVVRVPDKDLGESRIQVPHYHKARWVCDLGPVAASLGLTSLAGLLCRFKQGGRGQHTPP